MLLGRTNEIALVEHTLDAVAAGPAGFVLEGVAGIGKTTVWRHAVESARRRGYQVLETALAEPDSSLAFAGLADLFEDVGDEYLEDLPGVQRRALDAAIAGGNTVEAPRDPLALRRAVLGVLRGLSAADPVVVAIDDEQWLDPDSAHALAFALSRLRGERIGVAVARRPASGGTLVNELERRFGERGLEQIQMKPLDMVTMRRILEARLERVVAPPLVRQIYKYSGGNPLYAVAIADELQADHGTDAVARELPIPATLANALEARLGQLDPRSTDPMFAIAALSRPTLALLSAALPGFTMSDLDSADDAGVIEIRGERLRFAHPLLASTHYAAVAVSRRRALHRRLAAVIDDEVERARHIALGAETPDHEIALTLERAATAAARRGAREAAAQLLEDAVRLTPIEAVQERWSRTIAAAEQRFLSGDVSGARARLEALIPDLPAGALRATANLQLAFIRGGEPEASEALLKGALSDCGEDAALRVRIESELSFTAHNRGKLGLARSHAKSALTSAEESGDPTLLAQTLGQYVLTLAYAGDRVESDPLDRLAALGDVPTLPTHYQPRPILGQTLYSQGELASARPLLEAAVGHAMDRGEEYDHLGLLLILADLEWQAGDTTAAERYRSAAKEVVGEYSELIPWLLGLDALFALDRGELSLARERAQSAIALARQNEHVWLATHLTPILSAAELRRGEAAIAHKVLSEAREWTVANGYGPAGNPRVGLWSLDIEALLAMGRVDEAEELLADLRSRADYSQSLHMAALANRCGGLVLVARGDLAGAIDAMDAALRDHERAGRPLERGRTLLEKGSLERRARRKSAAKQTLEQALAILEPLEAAFWVGRARDELSRIGLRRSTGGDGLTPAQVRIAGLVVEGLSNPEIARTLHMSTRTVESHLRKVYRAHGVRSRAHLAALLAASAGAGGSPGNAA